MSVAESPIAGRVQQLDVLRGLAVLLVLVHHAPGGEGAVLRAGWTGVDLFFVLSGFLVSGLLFKEQLRSGRMRPLRFYLRRGLKIYPNFYAMLAVTSLALAVTRTPIESRNLLHELVFVQNYLPTAWWGREHAWSLAVEEHFYLLLPPVLLLLMGSGAFRRAPLRFAAVVMACLGTLTLAGRTFVVLRGADPLPVQFATHFRLDALAFGVLLSVVWHFSPGRIELFRRLRFVLIPLGLLLTAPCYFLVNEHPFIVTGGLTLNYLGYGMVLAAALTMPRLLPPPLARPLAWIGFYSYSVYLWHLPFLALCRVLGGSHLVGLLYYVGSVLIGVAMAKLVELPALRLRERWLPDEAARAPRAA